jgi:hypothetical protein
MARGLHLIPYFCILGIKFVGIIIRFKIQFEDSTHIPCESYCYPMAMEVGGLHPIQFLIAVYKEFNASCYRGGGPHSITVLIASYQEFNAQWYRGGGLYSLNFIVFY